MFSIVVIDQSPNSLRPFERGRAGLFRLRIHRGDDDRFAVIVTVNQPALNRSPEGVISAARRRSLQLTPFVVRIDKSQIIEVSRWSHSAENEQS